MAGKRKRTCPLLDATRHIEKEVDKTEELDIKYINSFKGRGVFAKTNFFKGDFVAQYRGNLIPFEESERRRRTYHEKCSVFMFDFRWKDKIWCIDAAQEDGSLGRVVNDDHRHPNCKMKRIVYAAKPHLCLFALRDIQPGEEITYNYGGTDCPWRTQTKDQPQAALSSESQLSRPAEMATESPPGPITQTKDQPQAAMSSESQLSRPAEIATESPPGPITQTKDQPQAALSSESQLSRPAEMATESPPGPITQTKDQPQAALSSESQLSRPAEMATESPPGPITQTKDQPQAAMSSESQLSRPAEMATESPPGPITQTKDQPQAALSSESQLSRPAEMATESPPGPITQTKDQPQAAMSSESQLSRPAEIATESPPGPITQTKDQPQAALSSESQLSRPAEMATESPPGPITQTKDQPQAALSSESQLSRPAEMATESPPGPITQTKDQPQAAMSSESQLSRPAEIATESPPGPITQTKDQPQAAMSSESQLSRPAEMATESPPGPITQTFCPSSDCDLTFADQSCPRLRRTKSIEMRGRLDFDSDELFDPTSDDSGEEYIPKSGPDSSEDTDSSEMGMADKEVNKLRFPDMDIGKQSRSLQGLDTAFLNPTSERGRSPVRKQSRSRRRMSTSNVNTEKKILENSDSEQTLTSRDSLFVPAVCKKDNGSRNYNKKQYCLYCEEGVIKMARHLERAHQSEIEVARAVSFPKNSKERRMQMEHLRNKGNFAHNVEVMNSGVGTLVPRQQPKDDSKAENFLHCSYCQGLFLRKVLWRHMKLCKFKPCIPLKPGRTRVQALCGFATPPPPGIRDQLWKLLNNMVHDDVYRAVKSDSCIIEYGEHLYNRLGHDLNKHEYIRQKLRELGRLLLCSRKSTQLRTIEEHIKPANFLHLVQAVKEIAGYNSEKGTYSCPSLALKIGYSLKKVSLLVESRANVQSDESAAKEARRFRSVYEARWNELISSASLRTLQESKWNTPQLLPFTKDVQTLHTFLDAEQQDLFHKLSSDTAIQTYTQLTKVILTQVILFNRRRAGEVSKISLSAYTSPNVSEPQEDVTVALSDLEKRLCQHFRRLEIRGKRGRKVPVLLTPTMQQTLDLLIGKRQVCGVIPENTYLFARPSSLMCYRGSDSLRNFAKVCGAKSPESLTSTKLRKQTGTLSQVLNLSNTELDQLADFLGHDIRVHRQFYRLPEGTLQLAKISKLLMALEQGRLASFKGKSLDDINIDPEEDVHFDSDQDGEPGGSCDLVTDHESDSEEHPGTRAKETVQYSTEEDTVMTTQTTDTHKRQTKLKGAKEHPGTRANETVVRTAPEEDTVTTTQTTDTQRKMKELKGKQPGKRKWDEEDIAAVERHMMSFITTCRVPRKSECDKCLDMERNALKKRDWLSIKFYVKNRITALKRKL